jgi:hypothetical protein
MAKLRGLLVFFAIRLLKKDKFLEGKKMYKFLEVKKMSKILIFYIF